MRPRSRQDLAVREGQIRDYQDRLGAPFPHDAYLNELAVLRDKLKAALSGFAGEPAAPPVPASPEASSSEGKQPTIADMAKRIKALKSRHTIEGATERKAKTPSPAPSR